MAKAIRRLRRFLRFNLCNLLNLWMNIAAKESIHRHPFQCDTVQPLFDKSAENGEPSRKGNLGDPWRLGGDLKSMYQFRPRVLVKAAGGVSSHAAHGPLLCPNSQRLLTPGDGTPVFPHKTEMGF
jgi:hypothetical protein